jgi:hypothetical protein
MLTLRAGSRGSAPCWISALLHQADLNADTPWPAPPPEQRIYRTNSFSF